VAVASLTDLPRNFLCYFLPQLCGTSCETWTVCSSPLCMHRLLSSASDCLPKPTLSSSCLPIPLSAINHALDLVACHAPQGSEVHECLPLYARKMHQTLECSWMLSEVDNTTTTTVKAGTDLTVSWCAAYLVECQRFSCDLQSPLS
jgi:hypothetical protein